MIKGKHPALLSTDKANKPKKGQNYRKTPWFLLQCSGSSQIPNQDDPNHHQFLSLYKTRRINNRTELVIYNTEYATEEVNILDTELRLNNSTSITQLPNGELFCYGNYNSGITLIIDRNYETRMLPDGIRCEFSSVLYFDNNIYCFGGYDRGRSLSLCRKFDLEKNRWINLSLLPETDYRCNSVVFNGNILVSGEESKNLWLYSIEIDSFSIIPYDFKRNTRKLMIIVEKLHLIEWSNDGCIYESEDEYHWKPISKLGQLCFPYQMYCLYNKEKIYISAGEYHYYHFDLNKKITYF